MSPAKLLGLPQTEDSIIVRAGASATFRALPRTFSLYARLDAEDGDPGRSRKVLRSLIALRRRGEKK